MEHRASLAYKVVVPHMLLPHGLVLVQPPSYFSSFLLFTIASHFLRSLHYFTPPMSLLGEIEHYPQVSIENFVFFLDLTTQQTKN